MPQRHAVWSSSFWERKKRSLILNNICLFEFKIVYCFAFGKIVKIIVDILTRFLSYCEIFTEEPKTWNPLDQLGSYRLRKLTFAKTKIYCR